jgi:8-oxo-dGTP pyrophosphatase MutT (NUDIX family)
MTSTTYNLTAQDGPDPTDPRDIDWAERQARALIPFDVVDGLPVNPLTDGRPAGRGGLWHWGEAVAADAMVLAHDTSNGGRYLLMVERSDGHGWALPGGMLDPNETPRTAAARELAEETGLQLDEVAFTMLAARGVPDPRAGANAWMVTVPAVTEIHVNRLPHVVGLDDARAAAWVSAASYRQLVNALASLNMAHLGGRVGAHVFAAHADLIREVLTLVRGTDARAALAARERGWQR